MRHYFDLTADITEKTTVYPGDPTYSSTNVVTLGEDSCFHLRKFTMGNHMGTHIDFPAHVVKGGKTSSDYPIGSLISESVILEVPPGVPCVGPGDFNLENIQEGDFVLFKTPNSEIPKDGEYRDEYVHLSVEMVEKLIELKVPLVGIDYMSVDSPDSETLPVHNTLLRNNVLIVENLNLKGVDPGRCKIFVMPINIPNMDGLPARVVAER